MPIPDYQTIMLPLLRFTRDDREHSVREVVDVLADQFGLTEEERAKLLPSGKQAVLGLDLNLRASSTCLSLYSSNCGLYGFGGGGAGQLAPW